MKFKEGKLYINKQNGIIGEYMVLSNNKIKEIPIIFREKDNTICMVDINDDNWEIYKEDNWNILDEYGIDEPDEPLTTLKQKILDDIENKTEDMNDEFKEP